MTSWAKQHKILLLVIGLLVLVGLNAWIFGSNFINQKQLLSAKQLQQYNQQLSQLADQASKFAHRQSSKPLSSEQAADTLDPIQHSVDEVILRLQTASYPTTLNDQVEQSLKLAQVLSFTLHNYQLQPTTPLSSASTSQVFHQASMNALELNQGK
jgi:hypothetical protein